MTKSKSTMIVAGLFAVLFGGCYKLDLGNGQLKCSVPDRKCPDGFHCASDGYCWMNGQDPTFDMATTGDMGMTAGPPPKSGAVVSGGVTAQSPHYKIIMSTAQAPGGNNTGASTNYQFRGGLSGSTQK